MSTPTYDPARHTISFGGNILTDFAADSLVEIEKDGDDFTYHPSSTGGGARARNRDGSHTIRVRLLQTSMSNDVLSAIRASDLLKGDGVKEFVVKDLDGATQFIGEAWIQKPPAMARGPEVGTYEWTLRCADPAVFFVGGTP